MASRKSPAPSTQIKQLREQVTKLNKELEQSKANYTYADKERDKLKEEVEQVHQILDCVPNSVPRKSEHVESYYQVERKIPTRLAAWLAIRN